MDLNTEKEGRERWRGSSDINTEKEERKPQGRLTSKIRERHSSGAALLVSNTSSIIKKVINFFGADWYLPWGESLMPLPTITIGAAGLIIVY